MLEAPPHWEHRSAPSAISTPHMRQILIVASLGRGYHIGYPASAGIGCGRSRLPLAPPHLSLRKPGLTVIPPDSYPVLPHVQRDTTRFRPCCGYRTLQAPNAMGLCLVCRWGEDGQRDSGASLMRHNVNGELSLEQARNGYSRNCAVHPWFLSYVRKPQVTER